MTTRKMETTYGSDPHGLVWGYRFSPGQGVQAITAEAALAFLATPPGEWVPNEFLWLHVSLSNVASEAWLRSLNLPDAFYDTLHTEIGSTRLEQEADSLVAVIHDVLFDFTFDASAIASTSLCLGPRLMVSARLKPLRSVDQLRAAVRADKPFRSPTDLLTHLLLVQAGVLVDILRQSTRRVDEIEDRLLANRVSTSRGELGHLRRVLVRLQRLLAPEPAALFRLLSRPPAWITRDDVQDLQQAAEEFSAVVADSVVLIERVKLIQEELVALVNEQTNRTLYVLTVVTVLALPVNLVAGLFGMNVGGMPLVEHHHGFLLIAGALILLTALLGYLTLGRRRD